MAVSLRLREFDVIVDTTGQQSGLNLTTGIARGGTINLFGWQKATTAGLDATKWHLGGFTVFNSSPSARFRGPFPPAIWLMDAGIIELRPLVAHSVPLTEHTSLMPGVIDGDASHKGSRSAVSAVRLSEGGPSW